MAGSRTGDRPHFEQVVVVERDALPAEPADRPGIPQGRHVHDCW